MCKTNVIIGHILLVIGIWVFSRGLINIDHFSKVALAHPVFWGLIMIFAGICAMQAKNSCTCETKPIKKKK
jgi:hypothetical protein